MVDTESERALQTRFEKLRADGQLCPCACENCPLQVVIDQEQPPRTSSDVVKDLFAIGEQMRQAPTVAEHDRLLDQWNLLRGESAAFVRKANEEFCRQHPEQCLP